MIEKVALILKQAARVIREQEQEAKELRKTIAQLQKTDGFRKLAQRMADEGLISHLAIEKKASQLSESDTPLETWEKAFDLALEKQSSIVAGIAGDDFSGRTDPFRTLYNTLLHGNEEQ